MPCLAKTPASSSTSCSTGLLHSYSQVIQDMISLLPLLWPNLYYPSYPSHSPFLYLLFTTLLSFSSLSPSPVSAPITLLSLFLTSPPFSTPLPFLSPSLPSPLPLPSLSPPFSLTSFYPPNSSVGHGETYPPAASWERILSE